MRNRLTIAFTCALAAACGGAWTPDAAAQEGAAQQAPAPADTRQWIGTIELPGGMALEFVAEFTRAPDGAWTGSMDIPAQGVEDLPLRDIVIDAGSMKFTFAPEGSPPQAWAIFDANTNAQGEVTSATMKQGGGEFPVKMKQRDAAADAEADTLRPQNPKPPFPYSQRELSIQNGEDQTRLVGTLITPGKPPQGELISPEKHPAVIFITGSGPQDRDETIFGHKPFLVIADHLARNGIASLRLDDRGVGGSSGDPLETTVYDIASDIKAAFNALRIQPDIDQARIGLIGHSEGGAVAPLVATDIPEVRFLVLMAGTGVRGRDVMTHQAAVLAKAQGKTDEQVARITEAHRALMDALVQGAPDEQIEAALRALVAAQTSGQTLPEEQLAQLLESQKRQLASKWLMSFLQYDPRVPLSRLRASVLALNGELDLQVDPEQNLPEIRKALEKAGNTDVTIKVMPGLNHLFQEAQTGHPAEYAVIRQTISPAALDLMTEWIRAHVGL